MRLTRWEVFDHTAGAYCAPHIAADCERCKRDGEAGDWVKYDEAMAEIETLNAGLGIQISQATALIARLQDDLDMVNAELRSVTCGDCAPPKPVGQIIGGYTCGTCGREFSADDMHNCLECANSRPRVHLKPEDVR